MSGSQKGLDLIYIILLPPLYLSRQVDGSWISASLNLSETENHTTESKVAMSLSSSLPSFKRLIMYRWCHFQNFHLQNDHFCLVWCSLSFSSESKPLCCAAGSSICLMSELMDLCDAAAWTNDMISFIACSCPSDSLWHVWTGQQMRGWKRELWYQVTDGRDGKVLPGDPPPPLRSPKRVILWNYSHQRITSLLLNLLSY